MNTKKKIFSVLVLSLMFISCGNPVQKNSDDSTTASFDIEHPEKMSFYDIFERMDIIPLETSDNSLISGHTMHQQIVNDTLYILDRGRKIHKFDANNGKYLGQFMKSGQGPDEYVYITYFTVHPDNKTITVAEPATSRLYTFDMASEKKIRTVRISYDNANGRFAISSFAPVNDSIYAVFSFIDSRILFYDVINGVRIGLQDIPLHENINKTKYVAPGVVFNKINDKVILFISYLNTIYEYQRGSFVPYIKLDLGKYGKVHEYFSTTMPREKAIEYLFENDDKYVSFWSMPFSSKNSIVFTGLHNRKHPILMYDTKTGEGKYAETLTEGIEIFPNIRQNGCYTYRLSQVKELLDENHLTNEKVLDDNNLRILSELKTDDNPVLLRYKIKQ